MKALPVSVLTALLLAATARAESLTLAANDSRSLENQKVRLEELHREVQAAVHQPSVVYVAVGNSDDFGWWKHRKWLPESDNFAAVFTAGVALWFWVSRSCAKRRNRKRLESFLYQASLDKRAYPNGIRSLTACIAAVGLSREQLMDAALGSDSVRVAVSKDGKGAAKAIRFQYREALPPKSRCIFWRSNSPAKEYLAGKRYWAPPSDED